jgi:hypothetical protein
MRGRTLPPVNPPRARADFIIMPKIPAQLDRIARNALDTIQRD